MANLIDTTQAEGTLTTFTRASKMSELAIALREPEAYTVFAPNDTVISSHVGSYDGRTVDLNAFQQG